MKWEIHNVDCTGSTNTDAAKAATNGVNEGFVIRANRQTSGRGRQGRTWVSQPGSGLFFSIVLRPKRPTADAVTLPLVAGIAVAEALEKFIHGTTDTTQATPSIGIKWPNDLLANGRKICGILCEMQADLSGVRHVVVGIGINANLDTSTLPPDVAEIATSLKMLSGHPVDAEEVFGNVLVSFAKAYDSWSENGFAAILPSLARRDVLRGQNITIELVGKPVSGIASGIAPTGALLLTKPDGSIDEIYSGEAHIIRPHG